MRLVHTVLVRGLLSCGVVGLAGCPGDDGRPATDPATSGGSTGGTDEDGGSNPITASTIDPSMTNGESGPGDDADSDSDGDTMAVDDTASDTGMDTGSVSASDSDGSTDGTGSDTMGGTDTGGGTDSGSTSGMASTSGATSTSGTTSASTSDTGSGSTTGTVCTPSPGNYDACINASGSVSSAMCGFTGAVCINDGGVPAFASVCSLTNCSDECECPDAPATGTAVVTCDEITGDTTNECYLDCSNGEACPNGMGCFIGFVCVWDEGTGPQSYDVCESNIDCPPEHICIVDDTTTPTQGVCTPVGCADETECPAAPATGDAVLTCADITTNDPANDCYLDCSNGETCPDGMQCLDNFLCIWPIP